MGAYGVEIVIKDSVLDNFLELAHREFKGGDYETEYKMLKNSAELVAGYFERAIPEEDR